MRRPRRIALVVGALVALLAVSFALARYLSTENDERDRVVGLLTEQAHGDAAAMLATLRGCDAGCRAQVRANASRLRRPGEVKIIAYQSGTSYALGSATGLTRVAWTVIDHGLPVVQCVLVRRGGNALTGRSVTLLRLSAPIDSQGSC